MSVGRKKNDKKAGNKTDKKPSKKAANDTAQIIKKVATTLFASKGFKSTSVKDITEHANVNIAAINYHFNSKENLLQEIVKDYASINVESVIRTLKKKANNLTELKIIFEIAFREQLEIAHEYRELMRIIRHEIAHMSDDVKDILVKALLGINDIFIEFIESGKERNLIDKNVDAMQVVLLIYSYVTTLHSDEILLLSKPYSDENMANTSYREYAISSISQILFHGIAA